MTVLMSNMYKYMYYVHIGVPMCRCPCCKRYPKIEGPIRVSYRSSYHGNRESYCIRTNDQWPTTFYPRRGEDDASTEFTAAFFKSRTKGESGRLSPVPESRKNNDQNVTFSSLEREHQAFGQQLVRIFYDTCKKWILCLPLQKGGEGGETEDTDDVRQRTP